jgi:hypothetical protein
MPPVKTLSTALFLLLATLLAQGCQTASETPLSRLDVQVVEVSVPIPCPALSSLGPEPAYPDTDEAIRSARNVAERALLYATGRVLRMNRLNEYQTAAKACDF